MDNNKTEKRGGFTSSIGFILASAGAAVGLGNLWKFPYIVGSSGGGLFIIFYIIFAIFLGIPIILSELSIGRKTQLGASAAYKKLDSNWAFVGIIGVLCSFILLCYYSVVGGWVIKYIVSYLMGSDFTQSSSEHFASFISDPIQPAIFNLIFMGICAFIVFLGVSNGIEKASKIMLPGLFIFLIILAVRSLFLPDAIKGLYFLFAPDFSAINSVEHVLTTLTAALSQMFFSLSLGMGITITYGSYLQKSENLQKSSFIIVILDTIVALLSGIVILPAVFSFGLKPSSGPGLMFETLPQVFNSIAFGNMFGAIFFILVFFAAVTSAIASLEVVSAFLIDSFRIKRHTAIILMATLISIVGVLTSLSNGLLSDFKIMNMTIFNFFVFLTDNLLMPVATIFTCIFVGHIIGTNKIISEIELGSGKLKYSRFFTVIMKYIAPVLISIIFVIGFIKR